VPPKPRTKPVSAEEIAAWNGKIQRGRGSLRLLPSGRVGARIKTAEGSQSLGPFATCEEAYFALAQVRWPGDALGLTEALTETFDRLLAEGRWLGSTARHRTIVFNTHVLPLCKAIESRDSRQQRDQAIERWWSSLRATPTARVGGWKLYTQLVKEARTRVEYEAVEVTAPRNAKKAPPPQERMPRSGESSAVEAEFKSNPQHYWLWQATFVIRRTGLRFSEALGLCPDALDEAAGTITVKRVQERPVYGASGGTTARNAPLRRGAKTSSSLRTIAVTTATMAELQSWCEGKRSSQPLIRTSVGSAPSSASASHILADAQRRLTSDGETMGWSWHGMRHEFLTRLGSTPGISIKDVALAAGHSSTEVTSRYMHTDRSRLASAVRSLDVT
jgi:integrase